MKTKQLIIFVVMILPTIIISAKAEGSIKDIPIRTDIRYAIALGSRQMSNFFDRDKDMEPYFYINLRENGTGEAHHALQIGIPHVVGRALWSMMLAEQEAGIPFPEKSLEIYTRYCKKSFNNKDHLNSFFDPGKNNQRFVEFHNIREGLLGLVALIRGRDSNWARDKAYKMVRKIKEITNPDGRFKIEYIEPRLTASGVTGLSVDATTSGRFAEVLMEYYYTTKDKGHAKNIQTISLAGTWEFQIDPHKLGEKEGWYNTRLDDSVRLPGSMDENKKGNKVVARSARHLNRMYKYTGVAWYQKKVEIPQSWDKKRITLFIERAHWSSKVWVDDQRVEGIQESLSVPHRHDLTDFLTLGAHTITVAIDNTVRFHLGGHSYSDSTQTNWNGMIGRIELQATDPVWVSGVKAYPNVSDKSVKVVATVGNMLDSEKKCRLCFSVADKRGQKKVTVAAKSQTEFTVDIKLPEDIELWDDFSPALHNLDVKLEVGKKYSHAKSVLFGMSEVSVIDNRIALNGNPVFLRGNVENCEFPLTGYPSANVEDWKKMFKVFQDYGLNHVRFHSYTPTEAAFIAADELGIILQTELPFWGLTGVDKEKDAYLSRELNRILDEYGNHPSFVMMCMGNELNIRAGDFDVVQEWVVRGQKKDPRHLYTASTSLFKKFRPTDEYLVATRMRQIHSAGTNWDHWATLNDYYDGKGIPAPVISHELGQRCVYPDFREIDKYTGVLRAENFNIFKESLEQNNMGDQAVDFVMASGKLTALLYRHEMESVFRTPNSGGFQLLQLHDFPGQGTAPIGILNVFRESKGLISPDEFRRSCSDAVALLRFEKRTWKNSETFKGAAEFIHYRKQAIKNARSKWAITTDAGKTIASGLFDPVDMPNTELISLGDISVDLGKVNKAARLTVTITVNGDITNDWNIWCYQEAKKAAGNVMITREWNDAAKDALNKGQSVLLIPKLQAGRNTIPVQFLPPFWSPLFKPSTSSTMGILCDPKHPVFADFPTDFHTNWQWYDILVTKKTPKDNRWTWPGFDTYCLVLDNLPADYRPLVQPIDHFYRNKRLGLLLEGRYGKGKLMICCADLDKDTYRRIAAPQLKQSILSYMNSDKFAPSFEFKDEMFKQWFDFMMETEEMKIKFFSSQHRNLKTEKIIDGNPFSHWMSDNKDGIKYPHEIHFEIPKPVVVKGFRYWPRQDFENYGFIGKYEIYVSDHAYHWYSPVASGEFKPGRGEQVVMFDKPKAGRNIRFVALEPMDKGDRMATMAEFELITEELTTFEDVP